MAGHGCKQLGIAGIIRKCQDIAINGRNGYKWLEMAINGWKWLEMAGNG